MISDSRNKGLTPVIAIVLLLFITVGAVGVVYTQFSGIIDEGEASTQETLSTLTSSISIVNGEASCNVVNTGDSSVDLSNAVLLADGSVVSGFSPGSLSAGGSTPCGSTVSQGDRLELRVDGTAIATSG